MDTGCVCTLLGMGARAPCQAEFGKWKVLARRGQQQQQVPNNNGPEQGKTATATACRKKALQWGAPALKAIFSVPSCKWITNANYIDLALSFDNLEAVNKFLDQQLMILMSQKKSASPIHGRCHMPKAPLCPISGLSYEPSIPGQTTNEAAPHDMNVTYT